MWDVEMVTMRFGEAMVMTNKETLPVACFDFYSNPFDITLALYSVRVENHMF
jgi:hypothetical protein